MKERILNGTKLVPSHPEELTQIYSISRLFTYNKTDLFKCVFQWVLINLYTPITTTTIKIYFHNPKFSWSISITIPVLYNYWSAFCHYRLDLSFSISYKWNHTARTILCLDFFKVVRFMHTITYIGSSFLFITNIPSYGCSVICLSIHLWMDIWFVSSLRLLWIKAL